MALSGRIKIFHTKVQLMACWKSNVIWRSGCKGWKPFVFVVVFISIMSAATGQTVADTFDAADIPTNLGTYSSTCNGPLTKLSVTLPPGGPWQVASIDIAYNMTALGGGWKSHQRSNIRCTNTAIAEDSIYQGVGNAGGVMPYNRTGVTIANSNYQGGSILQFEMRAWRTAIGSGCSTANNKVDVFSWIITVHYNAVPDEGSVGIGTTTPESSAILDLNSSSKAFLPPRMTTQDRNAITNPVPGMMIFNTSTQQLEIFTTGWGNISGQAPGFRKLLGGTLHDYGYSVQQTTDGGFIILGHTSSSNSGTIQGLINNGNFDFFVMKLDASGNIAWQKLYGGSNADFVGYIRQTSDGGYIAAGYSMSTNSGTLTGLTNNGLNDGWVLKLDNNGNITWQKLLGGLNDDFFTSVDETSDGGYVLTGFAFSSNSGTLSGITNNGNGDYWVIKLSTTGNTIWQKLLGGTNSDIAESIDAFNDGTIVVAGHTESSNSGTLSGLINNGSSDLWILKLDDNGQIIWNKLLGGNSIDNSHEIQTTSDGGYFLAAHSSSSNSGALTGLINNGANDYWILRLDEGGTILWQKLLGGTLNDYPYSLDITNDGGVVISGSSMSSNTGTLTGLFNNGSDDAWVIKLNNAGYIHWQKLLGGSASDISRRIRQTNDGGYIIVGESLSSNTGSLAGMINNGNTDCWVFKLDTNGNLY